VSVSAGSLKKLPMNFRETFRCDGLWKSNDWILADRDLDQDPGICFHFL